MKIQRGFIQSLKIGLNEAVSRFYAAKPIYNAGFTLVETLVAISLLVVAIAAPMTLVSQSLSSAFYARDQITAFHLAQEAVEAVRSVRDGNALNIVQGGTVDLLEGIPNTSGNPFTVNTLDNSMEECDIQNGCSPLQYNSDTHLYGYGVGGGWADTKFTRSARATQVGETDEEIRISVEVRWKSSVFQERAFSISENLYRWVESN